MGTLFIPNTLALIKKAAHGKAGKKLIDYLLSAEVEIALSRCPSAQIPLREDVSVSVRVKTPQEIPGMNIDFERAAGEWKKAARYIHGEFLK